MKKFTSIDKKAVGLDFEKDKQKILSNDIEKLDDQVIDDIKNTKLDGEFEIVSIIDVSTKLPKMDEAIIINAELGNGVMKRGDFIYITAQIKREGQTQAYHNMQMGVIKVRVVDIYNSMAVLNGLK